jgi:hypothetical protein
MGVGRSTRVYNYTSLTSRRCVSRPDFSTGISGRDRSGSASVCAAREGWCDEVWDFSGHPRISSGMFLGPLYTTVL